MELRSQIGRWRDCVSELKSHRIKHGEREVQ